VEGTGSTSARVRQAQFRGDVADVRTARRFVSDAFESFGLADEVYHAALATSELASNAVTHAATSFDVRVSHDDHRVKVEVYDRSSALPRSRHPSPDEPTGRGLRIVGECSQRWGVTPVAGAGKVVWFEIDHSPSLRPAHAGHVTVPNPHPHPPSA
jgi:anti-sigma regulatory factor (Ser/Thr protein kinase)